ncbi:S-adenosyl-L-methionine-dependent methyltransferase [Rhizodiscina lignyota]|uniref:S-adenosyl-L-methionine-dependent methyltransferase n=1 Tax=Rhizodiscina lignyota TaxID=1504668 RepID=A0A9P4IHC4_9PEZI|nr:S-adenosyl-L-methionine-dependent methyltransferase [Rhizodiscina lignyota]
MDHWSSAAYSSAASFVPKLTSTVVQYLAPRPTDRILDIGCGDGILTAQVAAMVPSGQVLGLDASQSMIKAAQEKSASSNCTYRVQDCAALLKSAPSDVLNGSWDKVFSNAALHWILRYAEPKASVFEAVREALKPDGVLVFEMGGAGNCAEIHAAMVAGLIARGIPTAEAHAASPWFFPSEAWMRKTLEDVGLVVEKLETEYRPTKLTPKTEDGKGGLEGWLKLMCAPFLDKFKTQKEKDDVVRWVADLLDGIITRTEDGSQWMGYVRLRVIARKSA